MVGYGTTHQHSVNCDVCGSVTGHLTMNMGQLEHVLVGRNIAVPVMQRRVMSDVWAAHIHDIS